MTQAGATCRKSAGFSLMILRSIASAALAALAFASASQAGTCPGKPEALGTARVIALDPSEHRRLGLMEYDETLPLADHEVVLTFDDGPIPPSTPKVLDALAAECVKATFFVVGEMARAHPALLRREFDEGHTIGTHTEHHPYLNRLPADAATREISGGIASVNKVLGGPFAAPFFRFPYLEPKAAQDALALKLGLTVWSTDIHANDWDRLPLSGSPGSRCSAWNATGRASSCCTTSTNGPRSPCPCCSRNSRRADTAWSMWRPPMRAIPRPPVAPGSGRTELAVSIDAQAESASGKSAKRFSDKDAR